MFNTFLGGFLSCLILAVIAIILYDFYHNKMVAKFEKEKERLKGWLDGEWTTFKTTTRNEWYTFKGGLVNRADEIETTIKTATEDIDKLKADILTIAADAKIDISKLESKNYEKILYMDRKAIP